MKNIPKKIHYFWFGPREPQIPYLDKVKELYKGYEVKIWREKDFNLFNEDEEKIEENWNAFTTFAYENGKWDYLSDYFRMKVLYEEGGIYLDAGMEPIKKFDVKSNANLFLGYEHRNAVALGFIASVPEHKFTKSVMEYYESLINPGFFPWDKVVVTEIVYSLYPELGIKNEEKEHQDLHIMDSNAFGLWEPSKKHESYFIHRHNLHEIHNTILKRITYMSAKLLKTLPAVAQTALAYDVKRMTDSKSKKLLLNRKLWTITVITDDGMLKKELFEKIAAEKQKVNVHLLYRNDKLKETLLKIYNVNEVTFGVEKSSFKFEGETTIVGNTNKEFEPEIQIQIKTTPYRTNMETTTNIYSRLFNSGVEKLILK